MKINKQIILNAMKEKNIKTQTELAERIGMNKSQLSQMLSDEFNPIKNNVEKLLKTLDLSIQEVLTLNYDNIEKNNTNNLIKETAEKYIQLELLEDEVFDRFKYKKNEFIDVSNIKKYRDYLSIETFAGAGGLALGMEKAGFSLHTAIEFDKNACDTLRVNRPYWNVIEADINKVAEQGLKKLDPFKFNLDLDLLTGGYPCQSFSYAGKRHGLNDVRGTLFYPYAQLLREMIPKVFIAENVKGLVNHDNGNTLSTMLKVFLENDYTVYWNVLNAWDYDVAQKRERIFIVGIRNDLINKQKYEYKFPKIKEKRPVLRDILSDVPKSKGILYSEKKKKVLTMVPPGGCWVDLPENVAKEYMGASYYSGGGKRGMARRLSWDEPSLTLTTSPSQKQTERCHPDETRPFTIREYARIQSFPDNWVFKGSIGNQYKQIGNAVPVNLAREVGLSVIHYLNQFSS